MIAENPVEEKPGELGSLDRLVARDEVSDAGEAIANHVDRVVAVRNRKFDDEVHRNREPRMGQDIEGL
jgi:hypothetical protein